jgi:hypothetical protein
VVSLIILATMGTRCTERSASQQLQRGTGNSSSAHHGYDRQQKLIVVDEPVVVPVERPKELCTVLALGASTGEQLSELRHRHRLQQRRTNGMRQTRWRLSVCWRARWARAE